MCVKRFTERYIYIFIYILGLERSILGLERSMLGLERSILGLEQSICGIYLFVCWNELLFVCLKLCVC